MYPGLASMGVVGPLEHDHAGAFAQDEAVASLVERADGAAGSSARLDNARIAAKPAMGRGWIAASAPPATTTSASPARSISSPIATAAPRTRRRSPARTRAGPQRQTDRRRRPVRHEHWDGVWADAGGSLLLCFVCSLLESAARFVVACQRPLREQGVCVHRT